MIRLSAHQFRAQAATAAAALAVFAVMLAATRPYLPGLHDSSGIAACQAHGDCVPLATSFVTRLAGFYTVLYFTGIGFLLLVPAVAGTFWAAPLLTREFEAGTFQPAWTQSVTRTRWLAARPGLGALAAMATAGLLSPLLTWWSGPADTAAPLRPGQQHHVHPARVPAVPRPRHHPPPATPRSPSRSESPARHDRRLDHVRPEHRPGRPPVQREHRQHLPGKQLSGLQQRAEQPPPQGP